ncbi:MAG TPA: ABC transporter permease, partial [Polyangiaceae bacterium]
MSALRSEVWERNPILARELRRALRTGRPLAMFLPIAPIIGVATLSSVAMTSARSSGEWAYQMYFSLAYFVVTLVLPAMAAVSFAVERQGRTWDALTLTPLGASSIARGKFWVNGVAAAALLATLAPLSFVVPLLQGPTVAEVLAALGLLGVIAMLALAFGCAIGAWSETSGRAFLVTFCGWL